jgi:group I intron endonuclease
MILVYLIRNRVNGKWYIGQTVQTLHNRFNGHTYDAFKTKSTNIIHCAIRKYGVASFEVLSLCSTEDQAQADRLERSFILIARGRKGQCYNILDGGKSSWVPDEAWRQKIRERFTPEVRERYRKRMTGRVVSQQTKDRLADSTRKRMKREYAQNPMRFREILAKGCLAPKDMVGSKNGNSKITEKDVRDIRALYAEGQLSQEEIGRRYGIIQNAVSKIVLRRIWKHV